MISLNVLKIALQKNMQASDDELGIDKPLNPKILTDQQELGRIGNYNNIYQKILVASILESLKMFSDNLTMFRSHFFFDN